jgi:predicted nucleotidyltransferase
MTSRKPDPELLEAFGRAVHRHFEEEIARERAESEARRVMVLPAVRRGVEQARAEGACGRAWLFGSYAWGEPSERSDVDILAQHCADPFRVASIVGRACALDAVHVIDWASAPQSLRDRVVEDGQPL